MEKLFFKDNLHSAIHLALRSWSTIDGSPESFLDFLLLVQQQRAQLGNTADNPSLLRLATNQILLDAITLLDTQDQTSARILKLRFPDNNKIMTVAHKLNIGENTVSRLQATAIDRLAEIIYQRELNCRQEQSQMIETLLPPASYSCLFGVEEAKKQLGVQLLRPQAPWVTAIVGLGGIGKTALADSVTRHVIQSFYFENVFWVRTDQSATMSGYTNAPQLTYEHLMTQIGQFLFEDVHQMSPEKRFIQVRQALKAKPYLIVIDNLETETDTAYLLARLNDLANPSKILITTRTRPAEQATVYSYSLDELSQADAISFIKYHGQDIGVQILRTATEEEVVSIYNLIGGNPLALKLVVSLLDVLPLPQILEDLPRGRGEPIEKMYKRIYLQTWQVLSPNAQTLLQAMPLVAEAGALPDYLLVMSGLTETQFWPAIQELRNRSLLEIRGNMREKRYGIHRLTETFLRTEIIHWPETQ